MYHSSQADVVTVDSGRLGTSRVGTDFDQDVLAVYFWRNHRLKSQPPLTQGVGVDQRL
jgi:hypothetical protein